MKLTATSDIQKLSIDSLRYQKTGTFSDRSFDFCYYEIKSSLTDEEAESLKGDHDSVSIQIKITKATEMNVYLYGGDKSEALVSIVNNNEQPATDKIYAVDYKKGMLIVAYPNEQKNSEFEFEYKVSGYTADKEIWEMFGLGKDDEVLFYIIVGVIVFIVALLCICIAMKKKKPYNNRVEIIDEEKMGQTQNIGGNETSVQLEEGEHVDENLNIGSK